MTALGKALRSASLFPSVGDALYEGVGSPTVTGRATGNKYFNGSCQKGHLLRH